MDNKTKSIFFVIYDGIQNSVFHSQVLTPIKHMHGQVWLVSFERSRDMPDVDYEHVRICKRFPFAAGLWLNALCLKKLLLKHKPDEIIARGPIAGWIVKKALSFARLKAKVVIQARGLAAEEFSYVMGHIAPRGIRNVLKKYVLQRYLYNRYKRIEHEAYTRDSCNADIHAVSPALRDYLIKHFDADSKRVSVSYADIPPAIDAGQVSTWRRQVREELRIPQDCYVYCYAGSARLWQQVDQMIDYARKTIQKEDKAYFLFLSQDTDVFEKACREMPQDRYMVRSIDPDQIYRYLSAADAGLLFREKSIVNWVSRPTKMLEYQAVGLKIIHNHTVAWLGSQ